MLTSAIGDLDWRTMHEIGFTWDLNVLWNRVVITADVNIIKVSRPEDEILPFVSAQLNLVFVDYPCFGFHQLCKRYL